SRSDALSSVKMHFVEYMWPFYEAVKATYDGIWNGKWCLVFRPGKNCGKKLPQPTTRKGSPCYCSCGAKLIESPEVPGEMICPSLIR
ncbi:MAG: hypothetical protein WBM07_10400, partial [Chitinivibrionales bacterium]